MRTLRSLGGDRGQSAAEYMGILLLVAVIVGALIASDVDGRIARATNDMVALISGGGKDSSGGTSSDEEAERAVICLGSTADAGNCLRAAGAANAVSEKINERAREKLMKAQRKLYNTARPGTPEYVKALSERDRALKEFLASRKITNNFIVKPLAQVRKVVDPRYKDIQKGLTRMGDGARTATAPRPNLSSGGPVTKSPASRFLKGLGKTGKGLGIAGTALSLYDNVKNDGVAKGLTKTAGGVGGAWAGGAAVTFACGAIGVATAGVGGLACAGLAFGAAYIGGRWGSDIAGWGYDRAEDVAGFANDNLFKPVGHATTTAVNKVKDVGEEAIDGGKKVIGALNPFG